jgi:hypothetical protein
MVSRKLARELVGHEVSTVPREGWAGLTNGVLLDSIDALFDVFITMDRGMRYQQRLTGRPIGIIEVRAPSTAIRALLPLVPGILGILDTLQPGEIVTIGASVPQANRYNQQDGGAAAAPPSCWA